MNYPLISEYVEAIKLAEDNLDQLSYLRPVLDNEGRPVMSSGNFAVVFKMKDIRNGNLYALKCFTRFQDGRDQAYKLISDELSKVMSPYLVSIKYIERELFVSSKNTADTEFPVAVMDWVEGVTLDKFIRQHIHEQSLLRKVSEKFNGMSLWLKSQPFAHGDLKPDNILTLEDGSVVLVDYDGMYVPAMKGQKARELGSPDYRHPSRSINDFNEHIDDFSLDSIAMQLYAISLQPEILTTSDGDTLLLSEKDYLDLGKSSAMKKILSLNRDTEFNKLIDAFLLAFSKDVLTELSIHSSATCKPVIIQTNVSTEATADDWANQIKDEFGAVYSIDGKRLLEGINIESYHIKPGTRVICDNAFLECSTLTNIIIPSSVTHIGNKAFYECYGLTNIIIPNSVTHIGNSAFSLCFYLTGITIPDSVVYIGKNAFSGCGLSVSSIQVNSNNEVYDSRENCNAIIHSASNTLVTGCSRTIIPNSITAIGDEAFLNCQDLINIIIPDSVTDIGNNAFVDCIGLSDITIPRSVTHIGNDAFRLCYGLTCINIPDSVTVIGNSAFEDCRDLSDITIPRSVTHIGNNAFRNCYSLTCINIPDSVVYIGDSAFKGCSFLTNIHVSSNNKEYDSREKCNAIIHTATNTLVAGCNDTKIPKSVTHIGNNAFSNRYGLTSVNIPDSVTCIDDFAFEDCKDLKNINIPFSVTHIGNGAFRSCSGLTCIQVDRSNNVYDSRDNCNAIIHTASDTLVAGCSETKIPDSVKHIGNYAFGWCQGLTSIKLPDSVKHIGNYAFGWCKGLTSIELPDSVTHIGDDAFTGCENLTTISIPGSVTNIGDEAFSFCGSLTKFNIPNSVTHIGDKAFLGCIKLTHIVIPDSVTYIGNSAFASCDSLISIIIPESVTHIGNGVFSFCKKLSEIHIPVGSYYKFKTLLPGFEHLFVELEEPPF